MRTANIVVLIDKTAILSLLTRANNVVSVILTDNTLSSFVRTSFYMSSQLMKITGVAPLLGLGIQLYMLSMKHPVRPNRACFVSMHARRRKGLTAALRNSQSDYHAICPLTNEWLRC